MALSVEVSVGKKETIIKNLEWLGKRIPHPEAAVTGDTFPMTWADDGEIYTSAGDPMWGGCGNDTGLDVEKIIGTPPAYTISRINLMPDYVGLGRQGPKPTGMICIDGVLYLAVQNLLGFKPPAHGEQSQHGSDAHIICSTDKGITWQPSRSKITAPMFPDCEFGGPALINFGKNNADARDGLVYAVSADQWDNGSELRLARVRAECITEANAWEWVSSLANPSQPEWTRELEKSVLVLVKERAVSTPEMVYLKSIQRYLLLTWRLHEDFSPNHGSELFIYEAPQPWGPFTLVHYEPMWEGRDVNAYCPRLPLKWLESDGLTGWLQFSGNWQSPHDRETFRPYYRSNVRRFKLWVG